MRTFGTLVALSSIVAHAVSVFALRTSIDTRDLADVCASLYNTPITVTTLGGSVTGRCPVSSHSVLFDQRTISHRMPSSRDDQ